MPRLAAVRIRIDADYATKSSLRAGTTATVMETRESEDHR